MRAAVGSKALPKPRMRAWIRAPRARASRSASSTSTAAPSAATKPVPPPVERAGRLDLEGVARASAPNRSRSACRIGGISSTQPTSAQRRVPTPPRRAAADRGQRAGFALDDGDVRTLGAGGDRDLRGRGVGHALGEAERRDHRGTFAAGHAQQSLGGFDGAEGGGHHHRARGVVARCDHAGVEQGHARRRRRRSWTGGPCGGRRRPTPRRDNRARSRTACRADPAGDTAMRRPPRRPGTRRRSAVASASRPQHAPATTPTPVITTARRPVTTALLAPPPEDEGGVGAAEAQVRRHGRAGRGGAARLPEHHVDAERRIDRRRRREWGAASRAQTDDGRHRLDRAGGPEQVADHALGRFHRQGAGARAEDAGEGGGLGGVVERRAGAVRVDEVDGGALEAGVRDRPRAWPRPPSRRRDWGRSCDWRRTTSRRRAARPAAWPRAPPRGRAIRAPAPPRLRRATCRPDRPGTAGTAARPPRAAN